MTANRGRFKIRVKKWWFFFSTKKVCGRFDIRPKVCDFFEEKKRFTSKLRLDLKFGPSFRELGLCLFQRVVS